jgi:aconitate hydratase 2/2-methylisocitrate dehydratase
MGNQAQVSEGSTVFSTSTRNFDNRLGKNSKVYLGSAEVAAVAALLGRLPSVQEYLDIVAKKINESNKDGVYKYLNFHQVTSEHLTTLLTSR